MIVRKFERRFSELALFVPDYVATDMMRVRCINYARRDELRMICHTGWTQTYTEFLNLPVRVEVDKATIRKSSMFRRGFGHIRGTFRGRGAGRVLTYVPLHQQGGHIDHIDHGLGIGRGEFRGNYQERN